MIIIIFVSICWIILGYRNEKTLTIPFWYLAVFLTRKVIKNSLNCLIFEIHFVIFYQHRSLTNNLPFPQYADGAIYFLRYCLICTFLNTPSPNLCKRFWYENEFSMLLEFVIPIPN